MQFLTKPFINIAVNGLALWFLVNLVSAIQYSGGIKLFVIGGLVLGLINFIIKPILKFVTFPLIILTGGLFLIIINIVVLFFLSSLLSSLQIEGISLLFPNISSYVIGAVVFGIINWILHLIIK